MGFINDIAIYVSGFSGAYLCKPLESNLWLMSKSWSTLNLYNTIPYKKYDWLFFVLSKKSFLLTQLGFHFTFTEVIVVLPQARTIMIGFFHCIMNASLICDKDRVCSVWKGNKFEITIIFVCLSVLLLYLFFCIITFDRWLFNFFLQYLVLALYVQ